MKRSYSVVGFSSHRLIKYRCVSTERLSGYLTVNTTVCVISKSNVHAVRVPFQITSMISDQNCTTQGSTFQLYYIHFEIAQIQDLVS